MPLSEAQRVELAGALDIIVDWRVEVLDGTGKVVRDITDRVSELVVEHDEDRLVHRRLEITTATRLSWGRDRLRVWATLTDPAGGLSEEVSQGVFILTTPRTRPAGRPPQYKVYGYDVLHRADQRIDRVVSYPAGEPILAAARDTLAASGLTDVLIADDRGGDVLPEARSWPLEDEKTYLEITNALLEMVAYSPAHADSAGRVVTGPHVLPSQRRAVWRYDVQGARSTVFDDPDARELEDDLTEAYNAWRLWQADAQRVAPPQEANGTLFVYNNYDIGPASINALDGRRQARVEAIEATTTEDLQANGWRIVDADLRRSRTATFASDVQPWHSYLESVEVIDRELELVGVYEHVGWRTDYVAREMTHTVRELVGGLPA